MKVKDLLTGPDKWTKGNFACDLDGHRANILTPAAHRFCLIGAVYQCYGLKEAPLVRERIMDRLGKQTAGGVVGWNDDEARTFDDVRRLVEELDI